MRFVVLGIVALAACGKHHERGPIDHEAAKKLFELVTIEAPPGMSDLAIDDRGVMWAISERDQKVLELELGKPPIVHALSGVERGIDTEAIGWLGNGRFAIGLEGANSKVAGFAFAELRDGGLHVTRTRLLALNEAGVEVTVNHGVEAVCGRGDEILGALETVGTFPDGSRWAPLIRLRGDVVMTTKLRLTTAKGKISALYCTFAADGGAEVFALERHFGVSRILRFELRADSAEVTPEVVLDLNPVLRDALNLEGLVRLPDGRFVAINDNQGSTVSGPTQLLVFHPR